METKRIMVVDDDRAMRRAIAMSLAKGGFEVHPAENAETAFALLPQWQPHLILLDIGLPGMDGLEALRHFRQRITAPVIFVTSRRRELDEIIGLELGADDYITKPFNLDVLLARVKTALRHALNAQPETTKGRVSAGDLAIDSATFCATLDGSKLELTPKEFDLLYYLVTRANEVVTVEDILTHVWGEEWIGESQTVYVHIRWLRKKIEADPAHPQRLLTLRGVGYKLVTQSPT
ncbi:MAG: response regulator transcription factor [Caldilineaceae bacterium]